MKEIDWEERHFQICLAILSCPVCNRHGHTDAPMVGTVINKANKMVELLKKNSAEKTELFFTPSEPISDKTAEISDMAKERKSNGLWGKKMIEGGKFGKIWQALEKLGYNLGDDVPYFHFNECCEELDINIDDIDVDKFAETYDINIG